jgi:prepilin-type processing-associated H-X9-DG protein
MGSDDRPRILGYETPARKLRGVFPWAFVIAVVLLGGVLASLYSVTTSRSLWLDGRIKSYANLRTIGQGIALYGNDHAGTFPDSFQGILLNEEITSETFVSPLSSDTPAQGPTTRAMADQLTAGGHLSYVYLGKGLTMRTVTPDTILAYEKLYPTSTGTNVLFGDFHVERVDGATAGKIVARATTGQLPVTRP